MLWSRAQDRNENNLESRAEMSKSAVAYPVLVSILYNKSRTFVTKLRME